MLDDDDEEDVQLDIMHSDIWKMWIFCSIYWLSHITSHFAMKVLHDAAIKWQMYAVH
jgi:hypothetical protein